MTSCCVEPKNNPAWLAPEDESAVQFRRPLFVRPLLIDVTKHDARVRLPPSSFPLLNETR